MAIDIEPVERIISGKGVIKIPSTYKKAHQIFLYADLIRNAKSPSINNTWNPDKGFYAHITFCIDDYVLYTFDMNFKQQVWEILNNQSSQNLLSLICSYDGVLDSFVQYAASQGIPYVKINRIKKHAYLTFRPNIIRFECFAECGIRLTLKGTELYRCEEEDGTDTSPPPPPPPPEQQYEPNQPIPVSEPYDSPDGDEDTDPFPIDEFPPLLELPFGVACDSYSVRADWIRSDGFIISQTIVISGRILRQENRPSPDNPLATDYGVIGEELNEATGICDKEKFNSFVSSPDDGELTIISIEAVI